MATIKAKILVIEDEQAIHKLIKSAVTSEDYQVVSAFDACEGIRAAAAHQPDLVILDLGLPGKAGFEVITSIRQWSDTLPILVLSARIDEASKVTALDQGANDYVTKPFSMLELMARIRALMRMRQQLQNDPSDLTVGPFKIDAAAHVVQKNGQELRLTPTEFKLLLLLIKNCNRVITHKELLKKVWGPGFSNDVQYLRVFMKQLRVKIEDTAAQPKFILTEPGIGYRFKWLD